MTSLPAEKSRNLLIHYFALFVVSLFLTLLSSEYPVIGRVGYKLASQLAYPFHYASNSISTYIKESFDSYIFLIDVKSKNQSLEKTVLEVKQENILLKERIIEAKKFKELLHFKNQQKLNGVAAQVIARDPSQWVRAITINLGESGGLKVGMPVVSDFAVVGQIIAVGKYTSKVMLIIDLQSGVDVIIQSSRVPAIVKGVGQNKPELSFVERSQPIKRGDSIVTSGLDGIFPKGLLVGYINEIIPSPPGSLFHKVYISAAAKLNKLEYVFVITGKEDGQ